MEAVGVRRDSVICVEVIFRYLGEEYYGRGISKVFLRVRGRVFLGVGVRGSFIKKAIWGWVLNNR